MDKTDGSLSKKKKKKKGNTSWVVLVITMTFVISISMSFVTNSLTENLNLAFAVVILLCIIAVGIVFDIIGIAVTAADETPFHALASKKKKGAKAAIRLIRNAEKVSSFCNDVVGDIAGIISGSTAAVIVIYIVNAFRIKSDIVPGMIITALVASLTVGGKAVGKSFAMKKSYHIVRFTANVLSLFGFGKK